MVILYYIILYYCILYIISSFFFINQDAVFGSDFQKDLKNKPSVKLMQSSGTIINMYYILHCSILHDCIMIILYFKTGSVL
jgi:hypothetical protein